MDKTLTQKVLGSSHAQAMKFAEDLDEQLDKKGVENEDDITWSNLKEGEIITAVKLAIKHRVEITVDQDSVCLEI
jgi:hypothetical protein